MDANPFLGVFLHAVGGLAAGSFYLPFKKVKDWSWEVYWIIGGVFSWIIAPFVVASILNPKLFEIISGSPPESFQHLWFWSLVGNRRLDLWVDRTVSRAFAWLRIGSRTLCVVRDDDPAYRGWHIPRSFSGCFRPHYHGRVAVCMVGIALSGRAGMVKEEELTG